MSGEKHHTHLLLHVVTLLALILSLGIVPAANAGPALPAHGSSPVTADAPSSGTGHALSTKADPNLPVRVIVQLADPPLASYTGGKPGLSATSPSATGATRLDVTSPASKAYLAYLQTQQAALRVQLAKVSPNARVDYTYQIAFNGLAIKVHQGELAALRALPGVKSVTVEREYKVEMDATIPLLGLGTGTVGQPDWVDSGLWAALGGHEHAGEGMKIADIDSGISYNNPCFNPTGYTYPAGFPKYGAGYAAFVNPKIIAARAYFRPDDPPKYAPTPEDDIEFGHGSHTAGTLACNYGTETPYGGLKISGVAPRAQLMVYRAFYTSVSGSQSAYDPELIKAIDDAIADGADVVNNSWGGTATITPDKDPLVAAYSAAVDAGVVVVFSAGNAGPGPGTLGSPATGAKFISAAATTTDRTFVASLGVTSVTPPDITIPVTVTNITGRSLLTESLTAPTIDLEVEGYADAIACNGPLPSALVSGKIVMVRRGVCALVSKVANAAVGGAVGVIIRNVPGGATTLPLINPVLPTAHIALADGENLKAFLKTVKDAGGTATITINGPALPVHTDVADTLASFSSRGPNVDMSLKPDIAAPGVNILSAVSYGNGFDFYQGTSMAAPHVTASAALLKQAHPTWTPAQIKSALMSTAEQPSVLGRNPMNRGAGRVSLSHPQDPGLTFDRPSLSFGLTIAGHTYTSTVTATDVSGAGGTYTVTATAAFGSVTPVVPTSITVPANGSTSFDVVVTVSAAGDAYGNINLTDGTTNHTLHIPYWTRTVAEAAPADVLLIDDDGSADDCGPDVSGFYTQTLTNLGLTYQIQEVVGPEFNIDLTQARLYPKVIYFTGAAGCGGDLSFYYDDLRNYLASGGKMLITGQDIAALDDFIVNRYGVSFNPALLFGAAYVQDSLYAGAVPVPAIGGDNTFSTYLMGQTYDISPTGNGAGNQTSVDEIEAQFYSDVDAFPILSSAPVTSTKKMGTVGTRMSSEPSIERVKGAAWTRLGYRSEFLSFGLEGVNNNTGFNTREQLLDRLLTWMDDEITLHITSPSSFAVAPYAPVTATVEAATSVVTTTTGFVNNILAYRWDFGDGTPIQVTTTPWAAHGYAAAGTYTLYVEAVDGFAHRAVVSQTVTISTVLPAPDLSGSTKTVDRATASGGQKLTYSLTIKNTGTAPAPHPMIADAIPVGTSFVAGSTTGGATYDATTNSITWSGGPLAAGAEHTISFQVTINADATVDAQIVNTATFKDASANIQVSKTATTTVVAPQILSISVSAEADTYLDRWQPTTNYDTAGRLSVRAADVYVPLLSFDLSALPTGAIVQKAEMKLYAYAKTNVGPMKVAVFQMRRPWDAAQATWLQADAGTPWEMPGANGPTDRSATPVAAQWLTSVRQWYTFDITSIAQNWANGATNAGVAIRYVDGDVMVAYNFIPSNYPNVMLRPVLTIEYISP